VNAGVRRNPRQATIRSESMAGVYCEYQRTPAKPDHRVPIP
jgi:hypothetical protein